MTDVAGPSIPEALGPAITPSKGLMGVQEVLTAALASEWTPKQALILERTENVESVVDAVQRVAAQLPQVHIPVHAMAPIIQSR